MNVYILRDGERVLASCTSQEALDAAKRLLVGMVLDVRPGETKQATFPVKAGEVFEIDLSANGVTMRRTS